MAIYRFSMKHGSRGKGSSSGAHVRYILRQERYDYSAHQLQYSASGNMPHWAESAPHFWDAADEHEAANARLYTEFEITLPRELTGEQQLTLAQDFIKTEIGDRHPYTMALHELEAMDGGTNPHIHIMFTTRTLDGIERDRELFFRRANSNHPEQGGAPKERRWMAKDRLMELRQSWGQQANLALNRAGQDTTIDCRALEERGIDRTPEPKLSPYEAMLWKQGVITKKVEQILTIRELASTQKQQAANTKTLITLDEIADLRRSEANIGKTLDQQRKLLELALSERDELDRTIERYDTKLSYAPGSRADANEMAKDRLYGQALEAYLEELNVRLVERDQIAEQVETQIRQGWAAIKHLPHLLHASKNLFDAQQQVNSARNAYDAYLREMDSSQVRTKCERFGEALYAAKMEDETKRNQLVEAALSVRHQITLHETLIADLEQMLTDTHRDMCAKQDNIPVELRMAIAPSHQQILVGQDAPQQTETQEMHTQRRDLKLQLALKLSLDAD